ncbi:MAG: hypothetical protein CL908_03215 [Deltaproteobacteria bacterium]|nr:hypothetical protein [Deltaproteobacteria bacterium]
MWRPGLARVLVIDACPEFRGVALSILKRHGHDAVEACDGLAGLQRVIEDAPDLVLVDAALPGLDGIEICSLLAKTPESSRVSVVVWSSEHEGPDRARALRAGARGFVMRACHPVALRDEADGTLGPWAEAWPIASTSRVVAGRSADGARRG